MTATEDVRQRSPLERHVQSGLLVLVMALLTWVGNSLVSLGKSVAVIEIQMGNLTAQVAGMYRTSDAQRDMADVDRQLNEVRRRIDKLERGGKDQ